MLSENSIKELKTNLRGGLIEPGDQAYDEARKVYNGMIHKRPRLIARCADAADVIHSVNFSREHNLLLAMRSGGHNAGGLGICDDGLVIDLGPIKYARVDPAARTVTVGAGCTWGDVDHATHAFGLATPSGIVSTTGVGGLTLGGGIAICEQSLHPGSIVGLRLNTSQKAVKAQTIVRDANTQARAFEVVDMDLEERAKLRKLLVQLGNVQKQTTPKERSKRTTRTFFSSPS